MVESREKIWVYFKEKMIIIDPFVFYRAKGKERGKVKQAACWSKEIHPKRKFLFGSCAPWMCLQDVVVCILDYLDNGHEAVHLVNDLSSLVTYLNRISHE